MYLYLYLGSLRRDLINSVGHIIVYANYYFSPERFCRELFANNFDVVTQLSFEASEYLIEHLPNEQHHFMIVMFKLHFQIETNEFSQVSIDQRKNKGFK